MKSAADLVRAFEALKCSKTEKIQWLHDASLEYEEQMPNDRTGQSTLYCLLGEAYLNGEGDIAEDCSNGGSFNTAEASLNGGDKQQAEAAFLKAKEILEKKIPVRKKVGCGYQEIEKDATDSREYEQVLKRIAALSD